MTVPAPGRAPAHPLARRAAPRASGVSSPHPACLGLQPLGVFLHPSPPAALVQRARPPAGASPGCVCPREASSLRCWTRWGGDGFQRPSVCAPAGRKRNHSLCLLAHSWKAAQTPRAGFSDRASRPPLRLRNENMPRCSPRAELEAVLGPDLAVAPIPSHPIRRSCGSQGPLHMLSCMLLLLRMQKEKKKVGVPRTRNVETHFRPEGGSVT